MTSKRASYLLSALKFLSRHGLIKAPPRPPPPSKLEKGQYFNKGVVYNEHNEVVSCLFCKIMEREQAGTIVYEDEDVVAFNTLAPSTSRHVLVCPRKHVATVDSLSGPSGVRLVQSLVAVGKKCVGDEDAQFSFHMPPWNSIDHLHLHAIGRRREMSWKARLKFWEGSNDWCKSAAACIEEIESAPAGDNPAPPRPS